MDLKRGNIVDVNEEAKVLLEERTPIRVYLHSSKGNMYEIGEEADLTEEQLDKFVYALYEVGFDLLVDKEGNAEIVKVDGKELK